MQGLSSGAYPFRLLIRRLKPHPYTPFYFYFPQARKVVPLAISEGRITDDWLVGKEIIFHSPEASKIEVRMQQCILSESDACQGCDDIPLPEGFFF